MGNQYLEPDLDRIYAAGSGGQKFPLGALHEDLMGRKFRFMKYNDGDDAVTPVAGYLAWGLDTGDEQWEVTCDYDSSTIKVLSKDPKGFAQAAFTDGSYGWFQTYGYNRKNITTDGNVAQNERLMGGAANGAVDSWATGSEQIAIAREDDGTTTSTILDPGEAFITIE